MCLIIIKLSLSHSKINVVSILTKLLSALIASNKSSYYDRHFKNRTKLLRSVFINAGAQTHKDTLGQNRLSSPGTSL